MAFFLSATAAEKPGTVSNVQVVGSSTNDTWTLPEERTVPWAPGIPGGIPNYSVSINVKDAPFGAKGDGVNDDSDGIANAIAAAPRGSAVYFPAGVYRVTKSITIVQNNSVVLRGAGPEKTKILSLANGGGSYNAAIWIAGSGSSAIPVLRASRGSTVIHVSSSSGLRVGNWVTIKENQDNRLIIGTLEHTTPLKAQNFQILSITGTNISVSRPLYWDYTNANFSPILSQRSFITNCGVEDLTLEMQGTATRGVFFLLAAHCWAQNVVITNSGEDGFCMEIAAQCTVKGCAVYKPQLAYKSRYGIHVSNLSSDNLVEDNILDGNSTGVLIQGGASGNVVSYNYVHRGFSQYAPTADLKFGVICHGDFANFNLFEGNNVTRMACDNYWGCNRANTFFRNWSRRQSLNENNEEVIYQLIAVRVDATNYFNSFVGNILCSPRDRGEQLTGNAMVWEIGDDQDNTSPGPPYPVDPKVEATTLRYGNFDYDTGTTNWGSEFTAKILPNSLYLQEKPPWFRSLHWPPIGPDVDTSDTIVSAPVIPAQARFMGVSY
jgi:parallel beta-helix repeat protein